VLRHTHNNNNKAVVDFCSSLYQSSLSSMSKVNDEELTPEQTEGFKVGEKKTIDEYQKLGKVVILHLIMTD